MGTGLYCEDRRFWKMSMWQRENLEHCHLKNKLNDSTTFVGNVCVYKFIEIDARTIFTGLARVQKNNKAKPNEALIEYAWKQGFLYGENEYDFLQNIKRKRNLSEKQVNWLIFINRRIVESIVVKFQLKKPIFLDYINIPIFPY